MVYTDDQKPCLKKTFFAWVRSRARASEPYEGLQRQVAPPPPILAPRLKSGIALPRSAPAEASARSRSWEQPAWPPEGPQEGVKRALGVVSFTGAGSDNSKVPPGALSSLLGALLRLSRNPEEALGRPRKAPRGLQEGCKKVSRGPQEGLEQAPPKWSRHCVSEGFLEI